MQDETPQRENTDTTTDDAVEEQRSLGAAMTTTAIAVGPTLPVVAKWGLDKLDERKETKDSGIILPRDKVSRVAGVK